MIAGGDGVEKNRLVQASVLTILGAVLASTGCNTCEPIAQPQTDNSRNLVFSPARTGLATRDVPRADWPLTEVYEDTADRITFQERITDVQGLSVWGQDYSLRRFSSVRTGSRRH